MRAGFSSGAILGEPVDFCRHDEIVFVQAFDLVGGERDIRVPPTKMNVRMMTFGLGELTHLVPEPDCFAKVRKTEASLNAARIVGELPCGRLRQQLFGSRSLKGRHAAFTGHTGLFGKLSHFANPCRLLTPAAEAFAMRSA